MTQPNDKALTSLWAQVLMSSLARSGVQHVVISPGSRSTPLTFAASGCDGLVLHRAIDERSAAFLALGLVRACGLPVALICTSGSAPAHYAPAIMEASHARLPLIVLSADRPPSLAHCEAPQTVDQRRLFGTFARLSLDLGVPLPRLDAFKALRRKIVQAVSTSLFPEPGPVQVNVPLAKPLEPADPASEPALVPIMQALDVAPLTQVAVGTISPSGADLARVAKTLSGVRRGVLVAGPVSPSDAPSLRQAVRRFCEQTGFALFAEATSQLRFEPDLASYRIDHFDALLRAGAFATEGEGRGSDDAPELVVQVGTPPTSGPLVQWLAQGTPRVVIAAHGWPDPSSDARALLRGEPAETLTALCERLPEVAYDYVARLRRADSVAKEACEKSGSAHAWSEGQVARACVAEAAAAQGALCVGNSLPIRMLDQWVTTESALPVFCQRGVNGIDGLVAGAIGVARGRRTPTLLLVGDVTFAHDAASLALLRASAHVVGATEEPGEGPRTPLVIVVVDNSGGQIFDHLPLGRTQAAADVFEYWTTPERVSADAWARAFELPCRSPRSVQELRDAIASGLCPSEAPESVQNADVRVTIIHAKVDGDARRESLGMVEELRARLAEAAR